MAHILQSTTTPEEVRPDRRSAKVSAEKSGAHQPPGGREDVLTIAHLQLEGHDEVDVAPPPDALVMPVPESNLPPSNGVRPSIIVKASSADIPSRQP